MYKTILFDLDGTLLPMDMDAFIQEYFKRLAIKVSPHGYDAKKMPTAIWSGVKAMIKNNGNCTNEEAFWEDFCNTFGKEAINDKPIFEDFYKNEFQQLKEICGFNPKSAEIVAKIKERGIPMILATNPIFPEIATRGRIGWAGLNADDFEFFTSYETSYHCKPNPEYFRDVLTRANLEPTDCLMVGNDAEEDACALALGIDVFLITDCLINKHNRDLSTIPHGTFDDLEKFLFA